MWYVILCYVINSDVFKEIFTLGKRGVTNPQKSSIYAGSTINHRLFQIENMLGFKIGSLPFTYLWVPIFKGKPNYW